MYIRATCLHGLCFQFILYDVLNILLVRMLHPPQLLARETHVQVPA